MSDAYDGRGNAGRGDRAPGDGGREDGSQGGAWVGAAILIAVGLVFLFQHLGYRVPGNWWALFILIPAAASLLRAWRDYGRDGLTAAVTGSLFGALVLVAIALVFLLGLHVDWGLLWPAILILLGVGMLGRAYLK